MRVCPLMRFIFFFFNDTATTEIYTLPLHDALPICGAPGRPIAVRNSPASTFRSALESPCRPPRAMRSPARRDGRSEEHTSELQSPCNLVCRLLLEKKKNININSQPQHIYHTTQTHD